jgi:hypothetical protein
VNVDLSILRMASRETESLSVAQVLVAKKRQEMELRLAREQVGKGEGTSGASIETTLQNMQQQSELNQPASPDLRGIVVDKTA